MYEAREKAIDDKSSAVSRLPLHCLQVLYSNSIDSKTVVAVTQEMSSER